MTKNPLVSIVIPNYNYENTISLTIESALNQTYSPIEIIVLDNNSTDNSFKVAKKYKKNGVKIYKNKYNIGVRSHNKAANLAKGKYIHILHSDDIIEPTFIEECVELMEMHQNVVATLVERIEIDGDGNQIGDYLPFYNCSCIFSGLSEKAVLTMASYYVPSQTVMRRDAFEQAGMYNIRYFMDWWMLFMLSNIGDFACIEKPLMKYRVWQSTETGYMTKNMLMPLSGFLIRHAILDYADFNNEESVLQRKEASILKQADLTLKLATDVLRVGDVEMGKRYLYLAKAQAEEISTSQLYMAIENYVNNERNRKLSIDQYLETHQLAGRRTQSYDPPNGYIKYSRK